MVPGGSHLPWSTVLFLPGTVFKVPSILSWQHFSSWALPFFTPFCCCGPWTRAAEDTHGCCFLPFVGVIAHVLVEDMPCARHCYRHWVYSSEQNGQNPCPQGVCILDRLETASRGMHSPPRLKQSKGGERREPRVAGRGSHVVMRCGRGVASLPSQTEPVAGFEQRNDRRTPSLSHLLGCCVENRL